MENLYITWPSNAYIVDKAIKASIASGHKPSKAFSFSKSNPADMCMYMSAVMSQNRAVTYSLTSMFSSEILHNVNVWIYVHKVDVIKWERRLNV